LHGGGAVVSTKKFRPIRGVTEDARDGGGRGLNKTGGVLGGMVDNRGGWVQRIVQVQGGLKTRGEKGRWGGREGKNLNSQVFLREVKWGKGKLDRNPESQKEKWMNRKKLLGSKDKFKGRSNSGQRDKKGGRVGSFGGGVLFWPGRGGKKSQS